MSADCERDEGSETISTVGGLTFWPEGMDSKAGDWVGVRGEESITEGGEISEFVGEPARRWRALP